MRRRGFFKALATIAAAPVVPLEDPIWHQKITYKVEPPADGAVVWREPELVDADGRLYRFNQPVVFLPGMRFEVEFDAP